MAQGYGTIFDPVVLQAFITGMGAFPAGTLVRLNDDSLGIVVSYHELSPLDRPVIRRLPYKSNVEIDLSKSENQHLRIVRSELPEDHGLEIKN